MWLFNLHCLERPCSDTSVTLRPVLMGNVWRPNILKHCLVTKHADVDVSGQMVKTRLIKHRSNYGYKPLSKRGTHACAKHVWYGCLNEQTSPIKHENKRNVLSCLIECLMAFNFFSNTTKHDQTRSNTIKQHQTRWPNDKMFGRQTMFDGVWSPNISL